MGQMESVALKTILEKAWTGRKVTRSNLRYLLSIDEHSFFAGIIRDTAVSLVRLWTENSAVILGSVGIESSPCAGGCKFCSFGSGYAVGDTFRMTKRQLTYAIKELCKDKDLYGLILVTMHGFDREYLLEMVDHARRKLPKECQLWVNIGDCDKAYLEELHDRGVEGIYHVCRLREGIDTRLKPERRIQTMKDAKAVGLKLFTCCEPIGPEHTVDELVDNIYLGIELGADFHAAMPRVCVPGSPMEAYGEISRERLSHIISCIIIAFSSVGRPWVAVHEPLLDGLLAGANVLMAEAGTNPRDTKINTKLGRGLNVQECRDLLHKAGFEGVRNGLRTMVPLLHSETYCN